MRRCLLTLGMGAVLLGWLVTPHMHGAIGPFVYEWPLLDGLDADSSVAAIGSPPQNCEPEDGCDCISDWVIRTYLDHRYAGNAYRILHTRKLSAFEIGLEFDVVVDLCFSVHRRLASDPGGGFESVWIGLPTQTQGAGVAQFYSSGPFDGATNPEITLAAGYDYALAVYWDASQDVGLGWKSGVPSGFADYLVEGYTYINSPAFATDCPDEIIFPSEGNDLTFSARLCLVPRPGACCRVDPGCEDILETDCTGQGSYFHGQGTTCAEVPCEFGACCDACGDCKPDYTPQACAAEGGTHTPGATCDDPATLCPVTTGACCTLSECEQKCEAECEADPFADYHGDGTTCEPNDCVGACCVDAETGADDGCIEYTQSFCEQWLSGEYKGNGTTCATLAADDICGGACCFAGGCMDDPALITSRAKCTEVPGGVPGAFYLGDGTSCPPDPPVDCPSVTNSGCCLPDGTCINTPAAFCTKNWVQGDDGGATPFTCPVACPVGACCFDDDRDCQLITKDACNIRGGDWTAETAGGTCDPDTCPPPVRACCAANMTCSLENEADCTAADGVFRADSTVCPPDPGCTAFGACCLGDGDCIDQIGVLTCIRTYGGAWAPGNACDSVTCPDLRGACCTGRGTCLFVLYDECMALVPHGEFIFDSDCVSAGCDPPGACCLSDGCVEVTGESCIASVEEDGYDGVYQGNETSCDEPQRCELGACCGPDDTCVDTHPEQDCPVEDHVFTGVGTTCGDADGDGIDDVCESGSCCLPETDACVDERQVLCEAREEVSHFFADSACDDEPSVCPPTGACCFVDETCTLLDEATCTDKQYNDNECSDTGASCDNNDDCDDGLCILTYWLPADVCDPPSDLCERGSCCSHADGLCKEDVIESVCLDQGQYHEFHQSLNCASVWCPVVGACCRGDGTCDEDVWDVDCPLPLDRFHPTTACEDVKPPCEPMGACCRHSAGVCDDAVLESDCAGEYENFYADRACDSVGECAQYGACCRAGSCTLEPNAADCAAEGEGVFVGTGVLCTPNPCYRVGACCSLADGICTPNVLDLDCPPLPSDDDCAAATYVHSGGSDCDRISCLPHGPCCLPGDYWGQNIEYRTHYQCEPGVCSDGAPCIVSAPDCGDAGYCNDDSPCIISDPFCSDGSACLPRCLAVGVGGFYGGDGAVCDDSLCTPGGCCLPDVGIESCQQRSVQGCEFGSGGFLGEGVECTYRCSGSGGLCDIANGSTDCAKTCTVDGDSCNSDADCDLNLGVCAGTAVRCNAATQNCGDLNWGGQCSDGNPCTVGAGTCYPVGYCTDGSPCSVTQPDCDDGSVCSMVCRALECIRESCQPIEDCVAVDCAPGACCRPDDTCNDNVVDVQCVGPLDSFHIGETCVDVADVCTALGACCFEGECTEKEPGVCTQGGGSYGGDGTLCEPELCVVSACCQPSEACVEDTRLGCELGGGIYQSGVVNCFEFYCTRGACCLADSTCVPDTVASECPSELGVFRPNDRFCAEECILSGACCRSDGTCEDGAENIQCAGVLDQFHYARTCADIQGECTRRGACCLDGACMIEEPGACDQSGGVYAGTSIECAPSDLCIVSGCCIGSECTMETRAACESAGGVYREDLTMCDPSPCCPDAVAAAVEWLEPPDTVVDARQPREHDDVTALLGIDTIVAGGPSDAHPDCWTLCETMPEDETANAITGVVEAPNGDGSSAYTITLQRRITPGAITEITYTSWSGATEVTGEFTSLPGDAGANGTSDVYDLADLVDCCLNQICSPAFGDYSCDIDHSGDATSADILRLLDVLNGAGDFLRPWEGQTPHDDGECP